MKFKNTETGEIIEEEIYFTGTDGKRYIQMTRFSDSYVLAVEANPGPFTPAPAIVCLRSIVKEKIKNNG